MRLERTKPLSRSVMRKSIVIALPLLLLVALAAAEILSPVGHWDGACRRNLAVLVVKASSLQPIANAEAAFVSPEYELVEKHPEFAKIKSDRSKWLARVRPSARTDAGGYSPTMLQMSAICCGRR